jgi:hypothetical protein
MLQHRPRLTEYVIALVGDCGGIVPQTNVVDVRVRHCTFMYMYILCSTSQHNVQYLEI